MEVQGIELGSRAGRAAVIDAVGMRTVRIIIAGRCRVVGQSRRRGTGSRLAFWRGCDRGGCDEGEWYVGRRWEGGGGGGGYHQFRVGPRGMKESGVTKPLSGADWWCTGKAGREGRLWHGGGHTQWTTAEGRALSADQKFGRMATDFPSEPNSLLGRGGEHARARGTPSSPSWVVVSRTAWRQQARYVLVAQPALRC